MIVDCDESWNPDSVLISVADSRVSFNAEQLRARDSLQFELQVPSQQIGPLRLEQFCVANEQANTADDSTIIVQSVLSAHVSLLCASDSEQSIRYVAVPLDVSLECVVPDPAED
jgi:hypothetical protein